MGIVVTIMVPHPPLIVPEVGRGDESGIPETVRAYHEAARMLASYKPETIVLCSPHQVMYSDYFHISPGKAAAGDFSRFRAAGVRMEVSYDTEFVWQLSEKAANKGIAAGTAGERDKALDHGTMVPLYFVNQYYTDYKLVRIGLSGLSLAEHYGLGQCIKETAERLGRRVAVIASGDLSHRLKEDGPYGFRAEGPVYDERIMDVMGRAAFGELFDFSDSLLDKAAECGHRSFVIMAGALDGMAVEAKRLSYEGPFGVGYGICTYRVNGQDETRRWKEQYDERQNKKRMERLENEDCYVRLAHRTIEEYVRTGKKPEMPDALPDELLRSRAGVFVSIKKNGSLRGCIGTIQAVRGCIAEEIIDNAVSAAAKDPRFSPITPDELDALTVSVDVLGDAEKISSPDELDVERYGVIVTKGFRRGLLLPNLEGVDTVEEQIAIARQKAGIGEHEKVELQRFEVVRHY